MALNRIFHNVRLEAPQRGRGGDPGTMAFHAI